MHLPEELICLILAKVYYISFPFNNPDYHTLSVCSLLSSHWRGPAQTLLFRRITLQAAPAFAKFADTTSNKALLSHVRALSIALTQSLLDRAGVCLVSTLISILGHCPQLYELSINAQLFSLGEDISSISAIVHAASISIRSLRLMECSVQSPILYELIGLFPSVEFLTVGVEIAAAPPPWTPAIQLYELTLYRTPPSDLLQWLLSSSGTSFRILEMRDLPSARTSVDLAVCCPHIQSLRLMRYNAHSAAILHQCTNLVELVLLHLPLSLPALPSSLEHFALLIQTSTIEVDLVPVVKAVESLPRLKIFTFMGESRDLEAICDAKGVAFRRLRRYWIMDDPVKTTRFPRRLSVSNFYSMN